MDDKEREQIDSAAVSWATAGCRAVASVASTANKAQPPTGHGHQKGKPRGYTAVATRLRRRNHTLLRILSTGPLHSLDHLDAANDLLLARLEGSLARMEGRPVPISLPQLPPPTQQSRQVSLRPQILFRTPVDNSRTPWKPRLAVKHNSISSTHDDYQHPYIVEINAYNPPPAYLRQQLVPTVRYKPFSETPYRYVDTVAQLDDLVRRLKTATEIAVDLEHHSYRSFQGFTCLIQISTDAGEDFIVDALALRDHLHVLNNTFSDPNVLKVFHGADCDVVWLQRDFNVYVVGLFDTHQAAVELDFPNKSLQNLLLQYCKVNTNKTLRLADWRVRPLEPELIEYARSDTHYLLYIWRMLRQELLKTGTPDRLSAVFQKSKLICLKLYSKPMLDESYAYEMSRKSRKNFNHRQMQALESLLAWRDEIARDEDESIAYVLPNHMLLHIASELPKETSGILACCCPPPPLVLHHLNFIHDLVNAARVKPIVEQKPKTIVIEDTPKPVTSIQIYNHQSLGNYMDHPNILSTMKKLKELCVHTEKTILSDHKVDRSQLVLNFVPPFHRRILVKKYNLHIKDEPQTSAENDALPNGNINDNSNAPSGKIITPTADVLSLDEPANTTTGDCKILFVSRASKTKLNDSVTVKEEFPAKKPKLEMDPEDDGKFQSFDYKSYNYNSFNKDDSKRNKKFKKRKNKW